MTISIDWANKLVLSTASITDVVAFKDTLRDFEDDAEGMLYDPIISYKRLDLGGGAYFHGVDFVNGYQLKFPNAGNYTVIGNIGAAIVPVAGVFVDRTKSAAFATVSGSGGGSGASAADVWAYASRSLTSSLDATAAEIAAAVRAAVAEELAQLTKVAKIHGVGVPLVVTATSRVAGDLSQTISTVGGTTTVSAV